VQTHSLLRTHISHNRDHNRTHAHKQAGVHMLIFWMGRSGINLIKSISHDKGRYPVLLHGNRRDPGTSSIVTYVHRAAMTHTDTAPNVQSNNNPAACKHPFCPTKQHRHREVSMIDRVKLTLSSRYARHTQDGGQLRAEVQIWSRDELRLSG
jgi:hypothetical protein